MDSLDKANKLAVTLADQEITEHLRAKNSQLESQLRNLLSATGRFRELLAEVKEAIVAIEPLPVVPYKATKIASSPIAAVIKLSDWQIGEVISAAETEGFGEFNFAIAESRLNTLTEKVIDWVSMHRRAGFLVEELHIFSEGDTVSGNIHYELEVTNEFPLPVATAKAGRLLGDVVARFAPHFKKVVVWEISADNHGRLTRKNQWKQGAKNNMSWLSHVIANSYLEAHKNVEIVQGDGVKLLADVLGKRFLLQHGHAVKSWMGVPYFGLERERGREATRRMGTEKEFDYLSCGHFHVPSIVSGNILINGSLPGTTEFDHSCGRNSPPSQVSFMVHPDHGCFNWTAWRLDSDVK